ncbi:MAG: DNA polymerase I, partial [Elusimicrobia bacterium]|nr:DNA polymerase I [Elusimicrobiota bacterium]MBD3412315.1 DNA polymerase I [Elusimicrobiota bacterium]
MPKPSIVIVDAHAYIHRAYHALPPLRSPQGMMVNAVFGFVRVLLKIIRDKKPHAIAVCFDHPAPTKRKEIFPEYKATRKEVDEDLKVQINLAQQTVEKLGLTHFSVPGYEADDIIATICREAEKKQYQSIIVSGDKDTMQLVSDTVSVWDIHKNKVMDRHAVIDRYGLEPEQLRDMFALMGDASDNIPGVPGIGQKTAFSLIRDYTSLDNLYAKINQLPAKIQSKLRENKDKAYLSRQLIELDTTVPLTVDFAVMPGSLPQASHDLLELFKNLGFNSLLNELNINPETHAQHPTSYCRVRTEDELTSVITRIQEKQLVALDVETTGLDPRKARLVGISVSVKPGEAWFLDLRDLSGEHIERFTGVISDPSVKVIGHNMKFDYLMLKNSGITLPNLYFDTMIASYLLDPSRSNHRLKSLALEMFSFSMREFSDLVGKGKNMKKIEDIDPDELAAYACADADATFRLYEVFKDALPHKNIAALFFDVEMPLLLTLAQMETDGIMLDVDYLKKLDREFTEKLNRIEKEIFEHAPEKFNINSSRQLSKILFEILKLPVVKRTKTGYSTDDDVLETLSEHHLLPRLIRQYREIQKLKSTYVNSMLEQYDKNTGRIHASFNQAITATGRLSSSNPNLQNIPVRTETGRLIRRAFVPEKTKRFLSADYSQIDLRVLAHMSGDPQLQKAFHEGGDIHRATAAEIYHVQPDQVTAEMRTRAKAINFGIVYGQGAFGLSQSLSITPAQAKEFISNYFERYAGVKQWIEKNLEQAQNTG